jgi:LysR family transcriptional regulator, regulator for bpeEF and oprC
MNQLQAIRAFARVVETGSFTKAADSLALPKATVSKLVQDLEAHLKVRLLQRTTRRVTVTQDGAAYYAQAAPAARELEDIDSDFSGAHGMPRGKVRVNVGGTLASLVLIPALPRFYEVFPDIQIELGVSDRPVDLISENVDCVIRGGAVKNEGMVARVLGKSAWVTCASPAYLKRHGKPRHPQDLQGDEHTIVTYQSALTGRTVPARFAKGAEKYEIVGRAALGVNESNAHLAAALAGLGIIHTFAYMVRAHVQRGELVPMLADWAPPAYPFSVAYPPNRRQSQRVRVFIDWLAEEFAELR